MLRMRRLAIASSILLATMVPTVAAQEKPKADLQNDVSRCGPKIVSQAPPPKLKAIRTRKGEKSTGFSPVIAFQILESGEVAHAGFLSKNLSGLTPCARSAKRFWFGYGAVPLFLSDHDALGYIVRFPYSAYKIN